MSECLIFAFDIIPLYMKFHKITLIPAGVFCGEKNAADRLFEKVCLPIPWNAGKIVRENGVAQSYGDVKAAKRMMVLKKIWVYILLTAFLAGVAAYSPAAQAAPAKTVMYFYGNTCPACKEAAPILERILAKGVAVEKYEVYDNRENADRMVMLFKMQGIPETEWAVPVAFYSGRMYMGVPRIEELEKELAAASEQNSAGLTDGRSDTMGMLGIMGAALADSVNPCAILVLVILLSFISLYHESRKRLILSAASFIFSVFLTYLLVGIGIVKALTFLGISDIVRNFVGILAILVGILNLKDFFFYGAGGFATEIPQAWRPFLFALLRKATTPWASFAMGSVVTLIELPCTGGPYFFALGILSKWGMSPTFFAYLALYNLIFVLPLVFVAILVYFGKVTVEKAADWQAKNSRRLHLIAGGLMLAAGIGVFISQ